MIFKTIHHAKRLFLLAVTFSIIAGMIAGCSGGSNSPGSKNPTPAEPPVPPETNLPLATVTFAVKIPAQPADGNISLEILDEVTGLALNPKQYAMLPAGENLFSVDIPIAIGSLVKYRYIRTGGVTAVEYTAAGNQVRYRMFQVDGPSSVQDLVAGWTDARYNGPTGRITGQILDAASHEPLPSVLVGAGGAQTFTASDGTFLLEGLIPGTHNLVAASLNGTFRVFQQGASVAEGATTPAAISVEMAKLVKVTFVAQIPAGEVKGLPVRIIGSSYLLGNTFGDLAGGTSVIAARAPLLSSVADNIYSLTLELPVGFDLRYKYTLGDGFWNAEHYTDGSFRTRQLIVPANDVTVTDIVESWKTGSRGPVVFSLSVPPETPAEDTISIQFNPFGWTAPIPMWPLGNNQWLYVLNGPLEFISDLNYRYCRNDQCGVADDADTHLTTSQGRTVSLNPEGQTINDSVLAWANWSPSTVSTTVIAPEFSPIGEQFSAGIELNPNYNPLWQAYLPLAMKNIKGLGANWVVFSPSWSYTQANPPVIEPVGGRDELWDDASGAIREAAAAGLQTAIFPRLQSDLLQEGIWNQAVTDAGWWETWFDHYQTFILNNADLAAQSQAGMLILGGPDVAPALPGGLLPDSNPSGVPDNAAERWQSILATVRGRFNGKLVWALPYPGNNAPLPEWLGEVDAVYVLFAPSLANSSEMTQTDLETAIGSLLDNDLQPIAAQTGKPVLLGLGYPAADGAANGCILIGDQCLPFDLLNQPVPDLPGVQVNLQQQADIYNAAFNAILGRPWIQGLISRGYYPPAALKDTSASIHGKPAADVLWYWFPKLLGQ